MQLVDVDPVETQSLQATFDRFAQVCRGGIVCPQIRPRAIPSTLGSDNKVPGIRRQRLGDQFFVEMGTIGISCIDEIDSQLDGAAEDGNCCGGILRWPPDSVARKAHGAEAKTVDGEFTT